jgi:hypothetical protein
LQSSFFKLCSPSVPPFKPHRPYSSSTSPPSQFLKFWSRLQVPRSRNSSNSGLVFKFPARPRNSLNSRFHPN